MINISNILSTAVPIFIFIFILGVIVVVHEFGHFIMARRAGIFVEEFAMGMGPKLIAIRGKKKAQTAIEGQEDVTLYTLRLLPLGGFCKMRGMEENIPDDPESMNNKSLLDRILVIAGGSAMNFILAVVLFFIITLIDGYTVPVATSVQTGRPAYTAGLQVGDRITHIDGSNVGLWDNFRFMLDTSGGESMDFRVVRDGQVIDMPITPVLDPDGVFRIGMSPDLRFGILSDMPEGGQRVGIGASLRTSTQMIGFHMRAPFRMLARFVTRQPLPEGAGVVSVIGIGAQVTEIYQVAVEHSVELVVITMIFVAALMSVAIGTMNLMPIPALDGARLVFLFLEGIRRKPISQEREGLVHMVGFVVLIALIVVIAARDIMNLL